MILRDLSSRSLRFLEGKIAQVVAKSQIRLLNDHCLGGETHSTYMSNWLRLVKYLSGGYCRISIV